MLRRSYLLPEVTVLSTREADVPLSNVPSSISIVDREEIQKEQAVSNRIEDILRRCGV
jgi:outer membrane receptor for ferrienterochelin and colicin